MPILPAFPIGPQHPPADSIEQGDCGAGVDNYFEYVIRAFGGFKKVFNGKHDVDIQVVSEFTKDQQNGFSYTGYGINPNLLNTPAGVTQGTSLNGLIATTTGNRQERALSAVMLLGKYSYLDKYTLNISFRNDGTSQLAPDRRYQDFYSAGFSWDALKEDFARNWRQVDKLHLRLSYGESANSDQFISGYFGYLPAYSAGSYAGQPSILPSFAGNPNLTWERIKTWNAGIDFGFFHNRVNGSLDVYHKATDGNIIPQQLSYTSGFASQPINAGMVVNKGKELAVNIDLVNISHFRWSAAEATCWLQPQRSDQPGAGNAFSARFGTGAGRASARQLLYGEMGRGGCVYGSAPVLR